MVTMGLVADTQLGADAAGIIKRVGPDVTLVKPGDRVATTCFGTYCSLMRVPETLLQKVPDHMTMEEGATLCCAYVTAYQSLVEIGRLERGETLLIHSAAGGKHSCLYCSCTIIQPLSYPFPSFKAKPVLLQFHVANALRETAANQSNLNHKALDKPPSSWRNTSAPKSL